MYSAQDEEEGSENSDVDDETTNATETNPSHSTQDQSHGSDSNSATHKVQSAKKVDILIRLFKFRQNVHSFFIIPDLFSEFCLHYL